MTDVLIALGSNLGDRAETLRAALGGLGGTVRLRAASRLYETEPMYELDQPRFLNAAAAGTTELGPFGLLAELKRLEREFGRTRGAANGPRELDLDLIAFGSLRLRSKRLALPHPRLAERRFVLQPLADVAPDFLLPGLGAVRELLLATEHQASGVQLYEHAALSIPGER